jgi:hypothetical protein
MKQQCDGWIDWRILSIFFVAGLAFACATLPSPQSIRDFKDIAGKWEATSTPRDARQSGKLGGGEAESPNVIKSLKSWVIIREDGNNETILADGKRFSWTGQLIGGKCRAPDGVFTFYHGGSGTRILDFRSDDGWVSMQYKPASK